MIIDGLTRSGKFYLGKLMSSIIDLEYFINSSELERLIQAGVTRLISQESASTLMAIAFNEEIYRRAIGRDMNLRSDDSSSIHNSWEKEAYLARQESEPGWNAVKKILDSNRYSVFLLHQSLMALEIIKGAIANPYIVNIRRHPVDLVFSWVQRGWGHRYISGDPLCFEISYQHDTADSCVPYFATDWSEEYFQANDYDRVVKSIIYLTEKESNAIDNCEDRMCHIYYDHLLSSPKEEISKVCAFLKKEPHLSMTKVLEKETRDQDILLSRSDKENQIYSNVKDKDSFEKLMSLSKAYEKCISA